MTLSKEQQERFDKKFGGDFDGNGNARAFYSGIRGDSSYEHSLYRDVKSFLAQEISLALAAREKEIVDEVNELLIRLERKLEECKTRYISEHPEKEWASRKGFYEDLGYVETAGKIRMANHLLKILLRSPKSEAMKKYREGQKAIELRECDSVPCAEKAKWVESSGDGRLVHVCTAHRRLLNKQKRINNNL